MLAASLLPPKVEHSDSNILAAMERLRYPVLVTLKKDGIRALRFNGSLLSRTLKPIPNKSIRERSLILPGGFDMELWNPELSYEEIESIVMSREHERSGEIQFHLLDNIASERVNYFDRINDLGNWCALTNFPQVEIGIVNRAYNAEQLFKLFVQAENDKGEGICFRLFNSSYKQGRSTLKEQYLVKLCRNLTSEARIVGFEEQMENVNETKRNAVGAMDRSSCGHNMIPKNTLGALKLRKDDTACPFCNGKKCIKCDYTGFMTFKIGTGFDDKTRQLIWNVHKTPTAYLNKIIVYKYKGGGKNLPRCPVWKGLRKESDIV